MSDAGMNAPNYRMLISRFSGSGQWDRTLETAQEWLATDPANSRAHLAAGQALLNLKRYPEADPHLRQALAAEPGNATAYRFMSISHFHNQHFKEADEAIQKAISLAPHDHYNWYHLAWMFYRNGDKASAARYAEKARALNPLDANVVNLLALCLPDDAVSAGRQLRQYEKVLSLDPENAEAHNNIGAYHLNVSKDYDAAVESFRRSLFFDPASKTARRNLFIAIKHRDSVYRILCLPRDLLFRCFAFMSQTRKRNIGLYILMLPVWIFGIRFLLAGLILWCLLIWPMVKVYEFLTVGDIRARAGEIGGRRGGFLGYRRWPVRVRLSIFGLCLVSFWTLPAWLILYGPFSSRVGGNNGDGFATAGGFLLMGAVVFFIVWRVHRMTKRRRAKSHARKRAKRMDGILEPELESE
jgi:tetratricopeptide (TPR) repeat protein